MGIEGTRVELARAKVNLTLRVHGRRPDGFHDLESLVAFADFGDRLTLDLATPPGVTVTGPGGAAIVGDNLVAVALALLAAENPALRLGHIHLEKVIPVAAGLGGGSVDAAAVLRLIRACNGEKAAKVDWMAVAARLGSDVPVCLASHTCMMSGRGERLQALDEVPEQHAVLVNPNVPVPPDKTRKVFEVLAAAPVDPHRKAIPMPTAGNDWNAYIERSRNDLEAAATAVVPAIAHILSNLRRHPRARLARLAGAGPTCFALVATEPDANHLADDLKTRFPTWWIQPVRLG